MKWLLPPLGAVCLMLFTSQLHATTRYVDLNCASPTPPYTDWSTAATNIQDAVNVAGIGDTVLVTNGVYQYGSYSLSGLNRVYIPSGRTVQSVNGPEVTIIQGYQIPGTTNGSTAIRCVYLSSGTTLSGFMLTNGATGTSTVGGSGGGAYCQADALLTNCVITGNVADHFGGGVYCESTNAVVEGCIVTNNYAFEGGGTFKGALNGCKLLNNSASANGGGASHSKLSNCEVTGNHASEGGGVFFSSLISCTVVSNSANTGGGVYDNNNDVPYGRYSNCVIYNNTAPTGSNYALIFIPNDALNFCCTLPLPTGGNGNLTNSPLFIDAAIGDYRLQPISPCINTGNNSNVANTTDVDGNPRIVDGTVDIGAYEFQSPLHFVRLNNAAPVSPFTNWLTAAANIQDAVDAANAGDFIVVSNGLYQTGGRVVYGSLTNRVVIDKSVTVQSVNGPSFTTIQGYQIPPSSTDYTNNVRCVYMTNNSVLSGFTITSGATLAAGTDITQLSGGGVFCESTNNSILTNCTLTRNLCFSQYHSFNCGGGAVYQGILNNCTLSNNMVSTNVMSYQVPGGGALRSVLNNCLIISNFSSFGGGAAFSILNGCSVIGNTVKSGSSIWGGGIYKCSATQCVIAGNAAFGILGNGGGDCLGTLNNCVLSNNFASNGGGSYQQTDGSYTPAINNCLIVSNLAAQGGGIYLAGTLSATNCTIFGNTATNQGGGIYSGILKNSIVYSNFCTSAFYGFSSNIYSTKLTNCWMINPVFENPALGDFHLQSNSPCINAGNNAYVSGTTDLDGNPRIVGGTVDIGAYEYQSPSSILSYAWAQQYGLPTDGSADNADPDGDGMNNYAEWKSYTNPTNSLSLLQLAAPAFTNSPDGIVVTWQSVANLTYYLQRSADLAGAFSSIQSNLVGQAGFTSYTDTSATNGGPYFYRVGVQ